MGCGSGRDLLWLAERVFKVTRFEQSAGLASLARKHAGCPVIEGDFCDFDFSSLVFDALVLVGRWFISPYRPCMRFLHLLPRLCNLAVICS
ncbi:class I SAM-dependent methyltransferase [Desulfogranum marinum]|uniref:class I SAM-dependent methyltransferase n=1 Tax=Desulfogranum marinum TaxID=453220 RepID=UPI00374DF573